MLVVEEGLRVELVAVGVLAPAVKAPAQWPIAVAEPRVGQVAVAESVAVELLPVDVVVAERQRVNQTSVGKIPG